MSNKMKRTMVLLLIMLKEAGPTAACSSSCSSGCDCYSRGLSSVPQHLPTNITGLYLWGNVITTVSQSDFSRYSSLASLTLGSNQISVINGRAFYNLTRLRFLYLDENQLTSLGADAFVGLHNLEFFNLRGNNISTIAAGAFANLPLLETLVLSYNRITTFPIEALSNMNSSGWHVDLSRNQMETLPPTAYDVLNSTVNSYSYIDISNNPWQCDCRMPPFKQKMTGVPDFEKQIICAGPANLAGSSLLAVDPEDLSCAETGTSASPGPVSGTSTSPGSTDGTSSGGSDDWFSLPSFLSSLLAVLVGVILILAVLFVIRCTKRSNKTSPVPIPAPVTRAEPWNRGQPRGHVQHSW
ncbi:uncharacterized protein LOC144865683 [Branchiostoma floridae x Branchiostoma japonicum]